MKKWKRGLLITGMILAINVIGCGVYVSDFYRADEDAIESFEVDNPIKKEVYNDRWVYLPEEAIAGFIFYPGGKVEFTAYEPLMESLASEGILCVLVEMPFNLAVMDIDAAEGIPELYPEVKSWYIGGHSLGGSMAATYVADYVEDYEGLVLLGSYSATDLSDSGLEALSVYGSEDKVLNREKYEKNKENLPKDFAEHELEGGCHAYFGMYGAQDGDGVPTISNTEQIQKTTELIVEFIGGIDAKYSYH